MVNIFILNVLVRFISGVGFAMAHLTVIFHASDVASKRMRQTISYAIVMVMATSTLCYAIVMRPHDIPYAIRLNHFGRDLLVLGVPILILIPLCTNESVQYYLNRAEMTKAQKKFAKLHSEREPSAETLSQFDEMRATEREDFENGSNIFGHENFKPLFTVLSARLLNLSLLNLPYISS